MQENRLLTGVENGELVPHDSFVRELCLLEFEESIDSQADEDFKGVGADGLRDK